MRGIIDPKGEQFGYVIGNMLYTLDGEPTGRLERDHVVDLAGAPVWRVFGDGIYTLNGLEPVGYLTAERPDNTFEF